MIILSLRNYEDEVVDRLRMLFGQDQIDRIAVPAFYLKGFAYIRAIPVNKDNSVINRIRMIHHQIIANNLADRKSK
jgi:hypothetical protein